MEIGYLLTAPCPNCLARRMLIIMVGVLTKISIDRPTTSQQFCAARCQTCRQHVTSLAGTGRLVTY